MPPLSKTDRGFMTSSQTTALKKKNFKNFITVECLFENYLLCKSILENCSRATVVKVDVGLFGAPRFPAALFEGHLSSRLALTVKSSGGAMMLKALALKEQSRIVADSFLSGSV